MVSKVSMVRAALAAAMWGAAGSAVAIQSRFNLAPPKTPIAEEVYSLHNLMLIICTAIFVAVFSVMFYSIWKHRKSKGAVAANWHENTTVEIIWTVIPFIIVIVMALPATKTVIAMKDTSNSDLTIKVTGYQWKWGYDYLRGEGEGIAFLSQLATPAAQIEGREPKSNTYLLEVDNPLVVPVNKKVRIITTASDVIHAWWVPAFAVKQDAIPGFARDTWFRAEQIGTFRGQCAELCGKDHAFMPIVVQVVSAEDYAKWVSAQEAADGGTRGRSEQDLDAGGTDGARRQRSTRPTARRATRRTGRACRVRSRRWPAARSSPAKRTRSPCC